MEVMIGADPELFVKKGDDWVTGHGLIPGTKEKPHPVSFGAVQVDGMALEFNINPGYGGIQIHHNIHSVLNELKKMLPEGHTLHAVPSVKFPDEYMKTMPKEALELGCEPDYNAYTKEANPSPSGFDPSMRSAGGHIHIGWREDGEIDEVHIEECCLLVKQLDLYLGIPSVILDKDKKRRAIYGKAGAFRPKRYGVEYRVLSNFWINSKTYIDWVTIACNRAITQLVNDGEPLFEKVERLLWKSVIKNTIDGGGVATARHIVDMFGSKWGFYLPSKPKWEEPLV